MIARLLGILIPPACREEVLGDLRERSTTTPLLAFEILRIVPFVVLSRILRTSDAVVVLMQAMASYTAFVLAAKWLQPALLADTGLARLALPAATMVAVLALSDAYSNPKYRSPLKPLKGVVLGLACVFLLDSIFHAIPRLVTVAGAGMTALLTGAVRMLFPPLENRPRQATGPAFWEKQDNAWPEAFLVPLCIMAIYVIHQIMKWKQ